jgi:hypothetical protein
MVVKKFRPQYEKDSKGNLLLTEKKLAELESCLNDVKNSLTVPEPSLLEFTSVTLCRTQLVNQILKKHKSSLYHYHPCPIYRGNPSIISSTLFAAFRRPSLCFSHLFHRALQPLLAPAQASSASTKRKGPYWGVSAAQRSISGALSRGFQGSDRASMHMLWRYQAQEGWEFNHIQH